MADEADLSVEANEKTAGGPARPAPACPPACRRIISASRRSDIAAFYSRWFLHRLEEGFCEWIHPFGGRLQRVSLRPEDCLALVFWTRNPAPLFPALRDLDAAGYFYYFHFSLTGYPKPLETHNPDLDVSVRRFRELADRIGAEKIIWRYDPIVISSATPHAFHLERFASIAERLEGATRRVYFSFVDPYGKTRRNFERVEREHGIRFADPDVSERRELVLRLSDIASSRGMTLFACCEDEFVSLDGVEKGRCVDLDRIRALQQTCDVPEKIERSPTRAQCGCTRSVDIGAYDTCVFGCTYCYATRSREIALARLREHDPHDTLLWRPPRLRENELENHG